MGTSAVAVVCLLALAQPGQPVKPAPALAPAAAPASAQAAAPSPSTPSARAAAIADRAIAYLLSKQDAATGGWTVPKAGEQRPHLPAITALALTGMAMDPKAAAHKAAIDSAAKYILSHRKADGGIYDAILPSYNTAISLSALAKVDSPEAKAAIEPAQNFLKRSQWGTAEPVGVGGAGGKEAPKPAAEITPDHPFYGGVGYGNRGRPDLSNLAFTLQAWHDTGLSVDDEAYKRAIIFIQRCQMLPVDSAGKPVNDQPYAKDSKQLGFIYATAENDQTIGQGQSFAGTIEETLDNGQKVSKLRAYGSMTYAGFKSYLYAGLTPQDPRVVAAVDWARTHWTLQENPATGSDGYYYFLVMFARAMEARNEPTLAVTAGAPYRSSALLTGVSASATPESIKTAISSQAGSPKLTTVIMLPGTRRAVVYVEKEDQMDALESAFAGVLVGNPGAPLFTGYAKAEPLAKGAAPLDWRTALIDRLEAMQNPDGSFVTIDDRWMENNPSLTTAYALVALQHARKTMK